MIVVRGRFVTSVLIEQGRQLCGLIAINVRGKKSFNWLWRDEWLGNGFNKRADQRECLLCGLEGQIPHSPKCVGRCPIRRKSSQFVHNAVIGSDRAGRNLATN